MRVRKIADYNCKLLSQIHFSSIIRASIEITLDANSRKEGEAAGSPYTRRESRGMKSPRREKTYGAL